MVSKSPLLESSKIVECQKFFFYEGNKRAKYSNEKTIFLISSLRDLYKSKKTTK